MKNKALRIVIGGGGTGGHIFPALSIADEIKRQLPDAEILFVGAESRMEMERIPAAGYKIIGLPVRGLVRSLTFENLLVIRDFLKSQRMARKIIKDFIPDVAIGVGGYASAPLLRAVSKMGVPYLLQEQNSYAGVTNKMLSKKAQKICVAYENMDKFFPSEKLLNTGNPVRDIRIEPELKEEARKHFNIKTNNPVLFIMGGSLGARTINEALTEGLERLAAEKIEVIWQTGKYYYKDICSQIEGKELPNIHVMDFVSRMDLAYNLADLVISRAGALSLSELCLVGRPSVLVPSPNVAEDHQTMNALALVKAGAAEMVEDSKAKAELISKSLSLLSNSEGLLELGANAKKLAKPYATKTIVNEVLKLIKEKAD